MGALPIGRRTILIFLKFCTIFQLEKCNTPEFCVLSYLLSMPVLLYKCGCDVGVVRGHHYFWLYSCYLSMKNYQIFSTETSLCTLCIHQILFLLMLRWFKYWGLQTFFVYWLRYSTIILDMNHNNHSHLNYNRILAIQQLNAYIRQLTINRITTCFYTT